MIAGPSLASAQTCPVDCVTNAVASSFAAGESQLSASVSGPMNSQATFTLTNFGPSPLLPTDVCFGERTLLGIAAVTNGSGVSFSQGATPQNPPGGNAIGFPTTAGRSADSDAPVKPDGVNNALAIGALRIGLHVQGLANAGSESFVTIVSPVSEGATAAHVPGGLGFVSHRARRRRARS